MECSCLVLIVMCLGASVANGSVVPMDSEVVLKSDGNNLELYKDSGNGSSWLQMVLVFARHSSNNQSKIVIPDKPCNGSQQGTTERPEVTTTSITTPASTTSPTTTTSTEAPVVCKEGFVQLESKKCYLLSNKTESWQTALNSCRSMGTTLAYPLNAQENTVLVNYVKKYFEGIASWWLGASDDVTEGQFVWAHSKSPIGYADWEVNQPDNSENAEDCLHINKLYGWRWNDERCNNLYNYICQQ